jgi:hypothetical protein
MLAVSFRQTDAVLRLVDEAMERIQAAAPRAAA